MVFEPPSGWQVKAVPFRLDAKGGDVLGSITAIDESTFGVLQEQHEQTARLEQPGVAATTVVSDVSFGQCRGKKYSHRMTAPAPWKQVDYLLRVPGGFVLIQLGAQAGADFDESPVESKLHTLRLSASA